MIIEKDWLFYLQYTVFKPFKAIDSNDRRLGHYILSKGNYKNEGMP